MNSYNIAPSNRCICIINIGYDAQIIRVSSDPVRAFEGSDAVFQWILSKDLTSRPDFQGLVFGLWKNGFLATYITTVTKAKRIILNPDLKDEAPQLEGRVQWRGDLSKSLAAFQISQVYAKDQMDYGLVLNFGPYRNPLSDTVRLEVKGKRLKSANVFTLNKYFKFPVRLELLTVAKEKFVYVSWYVLNIMRHSHQLN